MRLCAGLDRAVFKEHAHYRRGRPAGEAARIMAEGARSAGDVLALIADDADAVREQLGPLLIVGTGESPTSP